jgi:hypothetical protein
MRDRFRAILFKVAQGLSLFKRALALDPRSIEAQIGLALMGRGSTHCRRLREIQ